MDQKRSCCNLCQKSILPMFFSKSFIVSGHAFRSLIHFGLIFVYGVKEYSNCILLRIAVQFSQHYLLKRFSFLHLYSCFYCHRLGDHRYEGFSLGFLSCSIGLYFYFCASTILSDYCSFLLLSDVKEPDTSNSIFLSQDCFGFFSVFCVSIQIVKILF